MARLRGFIASLKKHEKNPHIVLTATHRAASQSWRVRFVGFSIVSMTSIPPRKRTIPRTQSAQMPVESIVPFLSNQLPAPSPPDAFGGRDPQLCREGFEVRRAILETHAIEPVAPSRHRFSLLLSERMQRLVALDGDRMHLHSRQGEIWIIPVDKPFSNQARERGECLQLTIQPHVLTEALEKSSHTRSLRIGPQPGAEDALLRGLMLTFMAEAQSGGANGRCFLDSLLTAFATHVMQRYGTEASDTAASTSTGLDDRRLKRTLSFLKQHYSQDIGLDELAGEAGMSKFHFIRRFKRSMGISPYQYLIKLRLDEALQLLRTGGMNVSQIAQATGFSDQSNFNAHFKRRFGTTPSTIGEGR